MNEGTCADGYFNCSNGGCVPPYFQCDGQYNCFDGQDEKDCGQVGEIGEAMANSSSRVEGWGPGGGGCYSPRGVMWQIQRGLGLGCPPIPPPPPLKFDRLLFFNPLLYQNALKIRLI